jgi:cobalt-zinc-cadmium efflux system outer membrane protein
VINPRRLVAALALVARLALPQAADETGAIPEKLTLDKAVEIAVARNPTLAAARESVEMSRGDAVNAGLRPNPALNLQTENYPYFGQSNRGPFLQSQEMTARVDYEFQTKNRIGLRKASAQLAVTRDQQAYQDEVRLLRLQVQSAFYRVLLAKSNLELSRSILAQTDEVIALNRARFEQGDISELDLTRAQVERLRFAGDVFAARMELKNSTAALLALLNASDLSSEVLTVGDLSQPLNLGLPVGLPVDDLFAMASRGRPDLHAAETEIERAIAQNRLQRAIASPNITVGGGYKRNGPDDSLVLGVTIPVNIFNRNQGGILRAEAETRQARRLAEATRNRLRLEVQQAYNAYQINQERVEYIRREQLRQAEQASQVTLAAYRLGGMPLMDYLDAQRQYRDTARVFNQAMFDEKLSLFVLAAAVGKGELP